MRIVSGVLKGRRFELPSGKWKTRPTTDYAKESLFNILFNWIELDGIEVLDLFSGTGNIAYEFASRGAANVVCVEKYAPCIRFIEKNSKNFGLEDILTLKRLDVFKFLGTHKHQYDVIFADPPYDSPKFSDITKLVFQQNLLKKGGLLIVEHDARQNFTNHDNFVEFRQYGQSYFSIFEQKMNA